MERAESHHFLQTFHRARSDPEQVVLEGLHPLKHALRFGAVLTEVLTPDREHLAKLAELIAPDRAAEIVRSATRVSRELFDRLAPKAPPTGVLALAARPRVDLRALLDDPKPAPLVLLDRPVHLGNLGAAVRVAAAAGAAGVISTGRHDPWHAEAVRGAAGLQFALPVTRIDSLPASDRPLIALDPGGEQLALGSVPERALLLFGSERDGLSPGLLGSAVRRFALPMQPGVSSLNLATTVAAVLYAWRLARQRPDQ